MDTPEPPGADPVCVNRHLHVAVLERANALATERAAETQRHRDRTAQQTSDYLRNMGKGNT